MATESTVRRRWLPSSFGSPITLRVKHLFLAKEVLAGGGVKGGYVHGQSDEIGEHVVEKPVTMPDLNATIAQSLGIDLQHIEHSPSGRPFTVADKGKPVTELFA